MTLNARIGVFMDFFGNFVLRDTFQEQIAPKPIELVDMHKLDISAVQENLRTRALKNVTP